MRRTKAVFRFWLCLPLLFAAGLVQSPVEAANTGYSVPVPSRLLMNVRETAGIGRAQEVVRSGVPLARSLNITNTSSLAVVDSAGNAVPAEFRVLARWHAGLNQAAPIQWVLVSFPVTISPGATAGYRLVIDGSVANPAPSRPLTLTRSGNSVTVDTGAAIFRLGTSAGSLFDEVVLDNGTRLIGGGNLGLRINGTSSGHSTTRRVWVEHSGPLSAVVVVEGAYDQAPIGNGQLSSVRRYVFTWGSPTAVVRHAVNWEGTLDAGCPGCISRNGVVNGVLVEQVRDALNVELGGTPTVTAVGALNAPAVEGSVPAGQAAWVRQLLRANRTAPLQFDVRAGGTATGTQANGGLLAASGPRGSVAVGIAQMHRYEPQALRLLEDGRVTVDVADGTTWLAHHQGLFATMAVSAFPQKPTRDDLNRAVWAPLNRPLYAWPEPAWFASSDAVEEFPIGALPADLANYDTLMSGVMSRTYQQIDEAGIPGLMTYGVYPRYWGRYGFHEMDCGDADPTPDKAWDNSFWCGSWTDYHNTLAAVPTWAMRSGEIEWLHEFAFPGALRTLHTQVMQCGPTERWFYCGQAPAGYGAYRSDFNSSHQYFDNLFLYYWLTGDSTVTRILQRGGDNMRRWMCPSRGVQPVLEPSAPSGGPCAPDAPINQSAILAGRSASQWIAAFRFLGLATNDATFLEDYQSSLARELTMHYAELVTSGKRYGFLNDHVMVLGGTNIARQTYVMGLYDSTNLFRLLRDTDDQPIGLPAIPPSQAVVALGRTIKDIHPNVYGDGTIQGLWPQGIFYTFSGSRLGGTLLTTAPEERELYGPEKSTTTALLVRSGQVSGDASLIERGRELTQFTIKSAIEETAPLGKLQGQYLSRLHSAVARLSGNTAAPQVSPPTAPSGLTATAASSTEIVLNWTDLSANEDQFLVERSAAGGAYQQILTVGAGVTTARATGLAASTGYSFRVRASNAGGTSAYSAVASATTPAAPVVPTPTAPAAPTGLTAAASSATEVTLNWTDASTNEEQFFIEQATAGGAYQHVLSAGAGITSINMTGLTPSTTYSFRVRASNATGSSGYSNIASASTPALPTTAGAPAAPSNVQVEVVSSQEVIVRWTDNSGNETQFLVEQAVSGGAYQQVRTTGANVTALNIGPLTPGTTYSYRVRAANASGTSAYSAPASGTTYSLPGTTPTPTVPAAPTGLTAQAVSATEITLNWTDASNNETQFLIERSVAGGTYQQVLTVGANVATARVTGLAASTSYSFRVRAGNGTGNSAYSNIASATTPAVPTSTTTTLPAAPINVRVTKVTNTEAQVTWTDKSNNETSFVIQKMVNGVYQTVLTVPANTITARVPGLTAGASYTFRVGAVNAAGTSYSRAGNVNMF